MQQNHELAKCQFGIGDNNLILPAEIPAHTTSKMKRRRRR